MTTIAALRAEYDAMRAYTNDNRYLEEVTAELPTAANEAEAALRAKVSDWNYQPGVQLEDVQEEMRTLVERGEEWQQYGVGMYAEPFVNRMIALSRAARTNVETQRNRVDRIVDEVLDPATTVARKTELRDQLAALPQQMLILKLNDADSISLVIESEPSARAMVLRQAWFENTGATRAEAEDLLQVGIDGFVPYGCVGDEISIYMIGNQPPVRVTQEYLDQFEPRVQAGILEALRRR